MISKEPNKSDVESAVLGNLLNGNKWIIVVFVLFTRPVKELH